MKRITSIIITIVAFVTIVFPASASSVRSQLHPYINILQVEQDKSVTIKAYNFPSNDTLRVTMGKYGSLGIGGVVVDFTDTGEGGAFTVTYTIPETLAGYERIAIRLQSPSSGYYAYNWFFNNTAIATPSTQPAPTATPTPPGYKGFPTFKITAVVKDRSVTISGTKFPANDTFTVLMGAYGTRGIGGINVGSTSTGSGGSLNATYNIPESLAGAKQIAIRLQSPTSGYFAYNWFYNNTYP